MPGQDRPGPQPTVQSPGPSASEDVHIIIHREAVEKLIRGAVPYEIKMEVGLFEQVVTLTDPRDITLQPDGLRLKMTATGAPIPFQAEIQPDIRIVRDQVTRRYNVTVQTMPVNMGAVGTYDLAAYVEPVPIESLSRYVLETPGRPITVDLHVQEIEVSDQGIAVSLGTDIH